MNYNSSEKKLISNANEPYPNVLHWMVKQVEYVSMRAFRITFCGGLCFVAHIWFTQLGFYKVTQVTRAFSCSCTLHSQLPERMLAGQRFIFYYFGGFFRGGGGGNQMIPEQIVIFLNVGVFTRSRYCKSKYCWRPQIPPLLHDF